MENRGTKIESLGCCPPQGFGCARPLCPRLTAHPGRRHLFKRQLTNNWPQSAVTRNTVDVFATGPL